MNNSSKKVVVVKDLCGLERIRSDWEKLQWHPNADIDYFMNYIRTSRKTSKCHMYFSSMKMELSNQYL